MRVTVVGAGIIGLTAALRLAESGHEVRVLADAFGEETTSAAAAAIWLPYLAHPAELVLEWSRRGFTVLSELAAVEGSGVRLREGRMLGADPEADWLTTVAGHRAVPGGVRARLPVVDMSVHLHWLAGVLHARGVPLVRQRVGRLGELADAELVVNCAGRGAQQLVEGERIEPVRGQVVVVEQFGLDEWVVDDIEGGQPTYVIPREHTVICGGTAVADDDPVPDPAVTQAILGRCRELVPGLAEARVLAGRVGLRPARDAVRLEFGVDGVLHCYGHGGAGVTMAYGCAERIARLAAGASRPLT